MSPNPRPSDVVMIEVSPKVVLSTLSLPPIPRLFDFQVGSVHIGDVETVGELCKFGGGAKGRLAKIVPNSVASDFQAANGVSDCDDASSPPLVEGLVGVCIRCVILEEAVVGSVENFVVYDAGNG